MGRGHLLKYSICLMHIPLPSIWKNDSFSEYVLWEISDGFDDTKPRGIEATCIIVVTVNDLGWVCVCVCVCVCVGGGHIVET